MNYGTSLCGALLVCIALVAPTSTSHAAKPKAAGSIRFVLQASSAEGVVRCGLFDRKGWLKTPLRSSVAKLQLVQRDGRKHYVATCVFSGLAPGEYGASAFHDADNDGELTTNLLGMPVEDYCATNDARGTFGPPSFENAKFRYKGGTLQLNARLR